MSASIDRRLRALERALGPPPGRLPEVIRVSGVLGAPPRAVAGKNVWRLLPGEDELAFERRAIHAAMALREAIIILGSPPDPADLAPEELAAIRAAHHAYAEDEVNFSVS